MIRLVPAAACLLLLTAGSVRSQEPAGAGGEDDALRAMLTATADRIVLGERCGECHAAEFEVWETTEHAAGFDTLHRRDRAKEIYRRLDLRLIKRGTDETTPACLSCHYTPVLRRGQLRAGAGVSCESCHGAARDWISVHNSYGVAEADFQRAARLETPEHRVQRIADSRAAGMRRPSELYDVAANCFGCHTVPNEELVNRGGHSTGSDFEIVAWSERIRHNFLESYKTADGRTNAERPREWKRRMYVVGRMLDLEYAVRGLAVATDSDDLYFGAMADRAFAAFDELVEVNDRVALPVMQQIIATWSAVDVSVDNAGPLRAVADAMREAARRFIASADATALTALDPLWDPTAEDFEAPVRVTEVPDTPLALPPVIEPAAAADTAGITPGESDGAALAAAPVSQPNASSTEPEAAPPPRSPSVAPAPPRAPRRIETLRRPAWRAPPTHAFVKVPCGRCHNRQERWWRSDPHSGTAKPFRGNEARNVEIAEAYGVAVGDMARGNQICMWCHGTPVSTPTRKVRAGVGCQRCHGAGADYLEPHETVGYADSVALGLTDLRTPPIQAATCAGCHYITDPGLIEAGHPSGDGFDMRSRIDEIVHWGAAFGRDTQPVDREALAVAYARVVADRGPAPTASRPLATPAVRSAASAVAPSAAGGVQRSGARTNEQNRTPQAPASVAAAPSSRPARTEGAAVERSQPPRSGAITANRRPAAARPPRVDDPGLEALRPDEDASVEETLIMLRERIESIYRVLQQ